MGGGWSELIENLSGFSSQKMGEIGFMVFLILMLVSLVSALFITWLYGRFYRYRATGSMIHRAFPLLGIAVTAIFICIQFSLPLSLGLLGALSIVRFRTPIKEPEEIGFIMVVVACSLSIATFNLVFLGVILTVTVLALLALSARRSFGARRSDGMVIIALPREDYKTKNGGILRLLKETIPRGRLASITHSDDEALISYSFVQLDENLLPTLQPSVQDVAINARVNVFFDQAADS